MDSPETWKALEGRVVDGKFPLRQWLGGSDHSVVFLTERAGQGARKFAIKFIAADPRDADPQLSRWRAAAKLSHPNLMPIFETGSCQVNGTALLYHVTEYADEDLSQILPQRPLTPEEVADMLPALVDTLAHVHGNGFVHGSIRPSNVLAVDNQLKLSTDQLRPSTESSIGGSRRDVYDAPETTAGILTPAGDLWSVGALLVTALTQKAPFAGEAAGDPSVPQFIPEPFRGIARECLHLDPRRRCSIADIKARMQPAARSIPAEPEVPPAPRPRAKRGPIAVGLVGLALLVGLVVLYSRGKNTTEPSPATVEQPAPQTAAAPTSAPPVREPEPAKKAVAAQGTVVRQVLPDVPQSAKNTITGTVNVSVRVEVDPSGKVTTAKLASSGPSKYFANLAVTAARQWEFSPTEVNGQPAASAWVLRFRFKRASTQVSPQRIAR
jgi:TonB family protein